MTGDGLGAVQLTLRFSSLDLNDTIVNWGEMGTLTAGINWHFNPNTRAMLNYVSADVETPAGSDFEAYTVQGRIQVDF